MFSKTALYQKSTKGAEAIATRQHGLAPRARTLLIMVDGKRGFGQLAQLAGTQEDAEVLLTQLLADGFIEEVAGSQPAAAGQAAASGATAAGPAAAKVSLQDARRFAVRRLTDILGPNAETLCLRIEAARTAQEFNAAVARAVGLMREFRGAQAAAAFAEEMQAHQPDG